MTTVKITKPANPVSDAQIAGFEERNELHLADSYKAFLLRTNGGEPNPDRLFVPGWHGGSTCVNRFFGLGENGHYDLENSLHNAADYIPPGFIPIAVDTGGNMLCLGTSDGYAGTVYFWDHEHPKGDDPKNLYEVANSLDDLLGKLCPFEPE